MNARKTRREFGRELGALALGGPLILPLIEKPAHGEATDKIGDKLIPEMACNFQASYMTWDSPPRDDPRPHARHNTPHGNIARIQLEALIDVIDAGSGKKERFVLIAPCRTEWVYAEDRLFQTPSAEYRNIYSTEKERNMSRSLTAAREPARGHAVEERFRSLKIDLQRFANSRLLERPAEIVEATAANRPLVARTEIPHPDGKRRYVLEYPIKTMNIQPKTNSFQVDTGPVLAADFHAEATDPIDTLEMAYVAFNRLDRAEFIVRRPTPVHDADGNPLCKVLHYSEVWQDPARTRVLTGEPT